MQKQGNILIVDDNEDILFALNLLLQPHVEKVKVTTQPERIEHFISTFHPDVILLDMNFNRDASSGQEGFFWLDKIKKADPDTVVIFITAYADTDKAAKLHKISTVLEQEYCDDGIRIKARLSEDQRNEYKMYIMQIQ